MEIRREISTIYLTEQEYSLIMQYWEDDSPIESKVEEKSTVTDELKEDSIIK